MKFPLVTVHISLFLQQSLVRCFLIGIKESELAYFKAPPNYPCHDNPIGGKYLKENRITFKGLTNAWNRTNEELVSGIWEKKHATSYFLVETVNKKAIEALIENAMNCKSFHFLEDNKELFTI
jgi:hypothetical protein